MCIRVKICGVTGSADALAAAEAGADAVGIVFANSPRQVTLEVAIEIVAVLPESVASVAVFSNAELREVEAVSRRVRPSLVQAEPRSDLIAALGPRLLPVFHDGASVGKELAEFRQTNPKAGTVLLEGEGRGGRGVRPDWRRARQLARLGPLVLAGGLSPANVAEAVRTVRPAGVDVSSGVEFAPGRKDDVLVMEFIERARRAGVKAAGRAVGGAPGAQSRAPTGFSA